MKILPLEWYHYLWRVTSSELWLEHETSRTRIKHKISTELLDISKYINIITELSSYNYLLANSNLVNVHVYMCVCARITFSPSLNIPLQCDRWLKNRIWRQTSNEAGRSYRKEKTGEMIRPNCTLHSDLRI